MDIIWFPSDVDKETHFPFLGVWKNKRHGISNLYQVFMNHTLIWGLGHLFLASLSNITNSSIRTTRSSGSKSVISRISIFLSVYKSG